MFMNVFLFVLVQLTELQKYIQDKKHLKAIEDAPTDGAQNLNEKSLTEEKIESELCLKSESAKLNVEVASTRSEYGSETSRDLREVDSSDGDTDATEVMYDMATSSSETSILSAIDRLAEDVKAKFDRVNVPLVEIKFPVVEKKPVNGVRKIEQRLKHAAGSVWKYLDKHLHRQKKELKALKAAPVDYQTYEVQVKESFEPSNEQIKCEENLTELNTDLQVKDEEKKVDLNENVERIEKLLDVSETLPDKLQSDLPIVIESNLKGVYSSLSDYGSLESSGHVADDQGVEDELDTESQKEFVALESKILSETAAKLSEELRGRAEELIESVGVCLPNKQTRPSIVSDYGSCSTPQNEEGVEEGEAEHVKVERQTEQWLSELKTPTETKVVLERSSSGDYDELNSLSDIGSNQSDGEFEDLYWHNLKGNENKPEQIEEEREVQKVVEKEAVDEIKESDIPTVAIEMLEENIESKISPELKESKELNGAAKIMELKQDKELVEAENLPALKQLIDLEVENKLENLSLAVKLEDGQIANEFKETELTPKSVEVHEVEAATNKMQDQVNEVGVNELRNNKTDDEKEATKIWQNEIIVTTNKSLVIDEGQLKEDIKNNVEVEQKEQREQVNEIAQKVESQIESVTETVEKQLLKVADKNEAVEEVVEQRNQFESELVKVNKVAELGAERNEIPKNENLFTVEQALVIDEEDQLTTDDKNIIEGKVEQKVEGEARQKLIPIEEKIESQIEKSLSSLKDETVEINEIKAETPVKLATILNEKTVGAPIISNGNENVGITSAKHVAAVIAQKPKIVVPTITTESIDKVASDKSKTDTESDSNNSCQQANNKLIENVGKTNSDEAEEEEEVAVTYRLKAKDLAYLHTRGVDAVDSAKHERPKSARSVEREREPLPERPVSEGATPRQKVQICISTVKFESAPAHERNEALMPDELCRPLSSLSWEATQPLGTISEVDAQLRREYVRSLRLSQVDEVPASTKAMDERITSPEVLQQWQLIDELDGILRNDIEKELQSMGATDAMLTTELRLREEGDAVDESAHAKQRSLDTHDVELRRDATHMLRSISEIKSRLPTCANVRSCNCCPYGYHIDLDFVRYCEALANAKPSEEELRRRSKRRSRKSMEFMLGMENLFEQFDEMATRVQTLPEAPHESESDTPYSSTLLTAGASPYALERQRSSSVPRFTYGGLTRPESPFGTASSTCSSRRGTESDVPYASLRRPALSPPETRAFLREALDDVCSDFERTLERTSGRRKKNTNATWTPGFADRNNNSKTLNQNHSRFKEKRNGYAWPSQYADELGK